MIVIHTKKDSAKIIGVKCDHFEIEQDGRVRIYGNRNMAFNGRIRPINHSKDKNLLSALINGVNDATFMEEFEEF